MGLKSIPLKDYTEALYEVDSSLQGVAQPLVLSPVAVQGGVQLYFANDLDITTRRTMTFRSKPAVFDPKTKSWSKFKRSCNISGAVNDGYGNFQANAVRIEVDTTAGAPKEAVIQLLNLAAIALSSTHATDFWTKGTPEV